MRSGLNKEKALGMTFFIIIMVLIYLFRVTHDQVTIFQMNSFGEVVDGSKIILTDHESIRDFTYAVRFARKQPGIVDIPAPLYNFVLGNRSYSLWIIEGNRYHGTLMKNSDTHYIYKLSKSTNQKLFNIIDEQYDSVK